MLSRAFLLISIRNVKLQLHEIPFGLDAIHILDEPALLLLLDHGGEEIIEGLAGVLQLGDLRPYPFRDGNPLGCSHGSIVSAYHIYNVAHE